MSYHDITIGFAGLSHLGLVHAIATSSKGFKVIAIDSSNNKINNLKKGQTDVAEPSLKKLLKFHRRNLIFSTDTKLFLDCDVVFISLDVQTNNKGKSDLSPILITVDQTIKYLKKESALVILSQVPPGFTRDIKLKFNDIEIYYQVETLIFGDAINRAQNPERLIIGCSETNRVLNKAYDNFLSAFQCPILPMRYESAELTKISINSFLAASVTITNTLAEISELIGADWSEIKPSLKLDKRIGPHGYLKPGLGISGGNLERDLKTIVQLGHKYGSHYEIINSIIGNSKYRKNWLWRTFKKTEIFGAKGKKISILGLSYKENTNSTKNSPSIKFIEKLSDYSVAVHDPKANPKLSEFVTLYSEIKECIHGADLLVIATPWSEYRNLDLVEIKKIMRGRTIIDPYQLINYDLAKFYGFNYNALGRSS